MDAATAHGHLAAIIDLYELGMRAPLPIACATSAAWAEARYRGKTPDEAHLLAKQVWEGGRWDGDSGDVEHRYVWPERHDLLDDSLFKTLATQLWYPLLGHEHLGRA
jgi:exodeoxyribonuclease V gamma subunit